MGATTPHLNLYKPGGGSSGLIVPDEIVDIDKINDNSDKIDVWSTATDVTMSSLVATRNATTKNYVGLASDRAALAGPLRIGDTYQETDGNKKRWLYDGAAWLSADVGMYLIAPTSVAGATVLPDGLIQPTAGGTVFTVNGCFSARFRSYLVVGHLTFSAAAATSIVLMSSGTPHVGATYSEQRLVSTVASTTSSSGSAQTSWPGAGITGQHLQGKWEFYSPFVTNVPKFLNIDVQSAPGQQFALSKCWVGNVDAFSYDGFRFTVTGQTFTGTVHGLKIYGLV